LVVHLTIQHLQGEIHSPEKRTAVPKINAWKMYVLLKTVLFQGDLLVLGGCNGCSAHDLQIILDLISQAGKGIQNKRRKPPDLQNSQEETCHPRITASWGQLSVFCWTSKISPSTVLVCIFTFAHRTARLAHAKDQPSL